MSYYVIKKKHAIPGFLFAAIASWEIANAIVMTLSVALWLSIWANMHIDDWFRSLPGLPSALVFLCIAYSLLGAVGLYVTMWIYWVAVERSSIPSRIAWLLALLFGLHIGAMIYALVVWKRDIIKVQGRQPLDAAL